MNEVQHIESARDQQDHLARQSLIELGQWVDQRGWCPATGGNLSHRLQDPSRCIVTASGIHKGQLTSKDFIEVDLQGKPLDLAESKRPSAETLVHVALYRLSPETKVVIHTHSILNTVLSRITPQDQLTLQGWEMQKAFSGQQTHETSIALAIFENTQDMDALALAIETRWKQNGGLRWGLMVRGHGLYSWGSSLQEARRHLEAIEFLLACHRELLMLKSRGV